MDIVLVHGAWCAGWIWSDVAELLRGQGRRVHVIDQLPSGGGEPVPLGDLTDDAAYLRRVLDDLGTEVMLVGHSYGGMVITELADHPGVRHSVYLTAFWPRKGQTLLDIRSEHTVEWLVAGADGTLRLTDDETVARQVLAADLDVERFADLHRRRTAQSITSFTTASSAPRRPHSTTYVICARDESIFVAEQEKMAAQADRVLRLDAPHLAPLSRSREVAAVLLDIA
jgi:pimeloyl-ACP methyl ester carboxylesterase